MVFLASFLQNNRLEHIHQVMGYHPAYLEAFLKTQHYLMREDGPLPFAHRQYIAIMVRNHHLPLLEKQFHTVWSRSLLNDVTILYVKHVCCYNLKNFLFFYILCVTQAAARHQCVYLVRLHAQEFLIQGGDPEWLRGFSYAPQKLQDLNDVNKILAHRPWLLTKQHIEVRASLTAPLTQ